MGLGRPKYMGILFSEMEREHLNSWRVPFSLAHDHFRWGQMIMRSADGETTSVITKQFGLGAPMVSHLRNRFLDHGIVGLHGKKGPGRPRFHGDGPIATLVNQTPPSGHKNATHWKTRSAAGETRTSKNRVHRYFIFLIFNPTGGGPSSFPPIRSSYKSVRNIVGRYLNPSDSAVVLRVDGNSQIHAGRAQVGYA